MRNINKVELLRDVHTMTLIGAAEKYGFKTSTGNPSVYQLRKYLTNLKNTDTKEEHQEFEIGDKIIRKNGTQKNIKYTIISITDEVVTFKSVLDNNMFYHTITPTKLQKTFRKSVTEHTYMLAIDTSTSMCTISSHVTTAVNNLLQQLASYPNINLGIINFDYNAYCVRDVSPIDETVYTHKASGTTALNDAIILGYNKLNAIKNATLIVITDGRENSSQQNKLKVAEFVKANSDITIVLLHHKDDSFTSVNYAATIGIMPNNTHSSTFTKTDITNWVNKITANIKYRDEQLIKGEQLNTEFFII